MKMTNEKWAEYFVNHPKALSKYLDDVEEIYNHLENENQQLRALITDSPSWIPEIKKIQDKMKEL